MADAVTPTAAVCGLTVAICAPFLRKLGLDPADTIFAAVACTCVQFLLPSEKERTLLDLAKWAVGSVLLATIATPFVAPWLAKQVGQVGSEEFRHVVAATLGGFAQPFLVFFRGIVVARLQKRSGNA